MVYELKDSLTILPINNYAPYEENLNRSEAMKSQTIYPYGIILMRYKQFVREILHQLKVPEAYRTIVRNFPFELAMAEERKRPTRVAATRDWFEERRALQSSPRAAFALKSVESSRFASSRNWFRERESLAQ
ncbi:hypothetical protein [Oscillatoria sp. FACHB-1406]|uniref:hypothetical protein n=1 Tax=Oscillatoria sp. FACHB-1406 TaxID=2692846 RepID=UPI0016886486|nr:hypothetical protein [Oscillatoria sp. FACHB-1406]MBD2577464.1 hypothetical protein [Oscillatoria sp. FACHB-1406]